MQIFSRAVKPPTWVATASLATAILLVPVSAALAAGVAAPAELELSPIVQNAVDAFASGNPGTMVNVRGGNITRVYGKAFSGGASPIASAEAFLNAQAGIFGVNAADLLPMGPFPDGARVVPLVYEPVTESYKFTLVSSCQHLNGVPVFRSDIRVLVRNEPGFPSVLATSSLKDLGAFATNFRGGPVAPGAINQGPLLRAVQNQFREKPTISATEMVIWAGVDEQPAEPRLAYKFMAQGGLVFTPQTYKKFLYVVDALTGQILYQENQICNIDVVGSVKGVATQGSGADLCHEEVAEGLPYAAVNLGSTTAYTDVDGNFVALGVSAGTNSATSTLDGLYFTVNDIQTDVSSITTFLSGAPVDFLHNAPNTDALVRAQINAYIEANVARDLIMAHNPSYPVIANQFGPTAFQINTNLDSTCNAFYDGPSINFFHAAGGCANTAFGSVVHHEYGHHLVQSGGSGQGAYGEGMSDCLGILVTDESVTGFGFNNNCNAGIRNADNNCQQVPGECSSCGNAIHACGQLISGCVWDLRENFLDKYPSDYRDRLASIVVNAVPLHGPTSSIQADITIDYLTLNDDNADITDGTPDYAEIADAFGQHNLPAPPILALKFTFPNGLPTNVNPNGTTTLDVTVTGLTGTPQANTGKFFWRSGTAGPFTLVNMTQTSPNSYQVAIPSTVCLSTVQFYLQAQTTTNLTVSSPANAPTTVYSAISAGGVSLVFTDELETGGAGWTVGLPSDTATSGEWELVDPNGTAAQPESDHTVLGTHCFITGQGSPGGSLGEADIDGGVTTLMSPAFSAIGSDATFVTYWRWYSNNTGAAPNSDSMPVEISNNGGISWTVLENVTENAAAWVFKSFRISDFVTPTADMRVRWRASDLGAGSLVEAGVDDVFINGYSCAEAVVGDLDGDGNVNAADLAILLGAWGGDGPADLNNDGTVNAADLAILLGNF